MRHLAQLIVVLLALAGPQAASAVVAPAVVPGWPVRTAQGSVHQGPHGGVVVISSDQSGETVRAFTGAGRRAWSTTRALGCGNCEASAKRVDLQADGTYGPLGASGNFWSIDQTGGVAPGCTGVVETDGTCFFAGSGPPVAPFQTPYFAASRGGTILWSFVTTGFTWLSDFTGPPVVAQDRGGLLYAAFAGAVTPGGTSNRLLAVDPVSRSVLWSRTGPTSVLIALDSGVLVYENGGLTAVRADGTTAWTRPLPAGAYMTPSDVARDRARHRLYVGRRDKKPGVTALNANTGAQIWRTRPVDAARLVSLGESGTVYLGIDTRGKTAARAVNPRGRLLWQHRMQRRIFGVTGVRELRSGLVAVSELGRSKRPTGLLTLLDPR